MTDSERKGDSLTSQLPPINIQETPSSTTTTTTSTVEPTAYLPSPSVGPLTSTTHPRQFMDEGNYHENAERDYYQEAHPQREGHHLPRPRTPEIIVSPEVARVPNDHHPYGSRPNDVRHVGGEAGVRNTFNRVPTPPVVSLGTVTIRAEEIALVLVVLMLWAGAITLFINRWGKLRMLEPYQPAYTAPSPPPRAPQSQVGPFINIQSTSDLTLCEGGAAGGYDWGAPENYGRGSLASGYLGMSRSPSALSVRNLDPTRKVKSAVDLVSLVMQEKMSSNLHLAATNV